MTAAARLLAAIFVTSQGVMLSCPALAQDTGSRASQATEVFSTAAPSVVVIRAERPGGVIAQGSGVVFHREPLDNDSWVATNCHVVLRATRIVVSSAGDVHRAKLVSADSDLDLCLLIADGLPAPAAQVRSTPPLSVGESVYAIGAPRGLELSLSNGIVSQLRRHPSTYRLIQTTAPISRGSSGGGLFDGEGRLIGITTFFLREAQNLNFAIPATTVEDLQFASVVITMATLLSEKPESGFASTLDQAVPGWRRDLESAPFSRWLGLARDAKGQRRSGGISGIAFLAAGTVGQPGSWQEAVQLFRDYRTSPFCRTK